MRKKNIFFFTPTDKNPPLNIEKYVYTWYNLELWWDYIGRIIGGLWNRSCQTWCRCQWDFLYSFWIKKRAWNRGWIGSAKYISSRAAILDTLYFRGNFTKSFLQIFPWNHFHENFREIDFTEKELGIKQFFLKLLRYTLF